MPRLPNPHAGQTTESLVNKELDRGDIPTVCFGCGAVSSISARRFTETLSASCPQVLGSCEGCGETFVPVDEDARPLDLGHASKACESARWAGKENHVTESDVEEVA